MIGSQMWRGVTFLIALPAVVGRAHVPAPRFRELCTRRLTLVATALASAALVITLLASTGLEDPAASAVRGLGLVGEAMSLAFDGQMQQPRDECEQVSANPVLGQVAEALSIRSDVNCSDIFPPIRQGRQP